MDLGFANEQNQKSVDLGFDTTCNKPVLVMEINRNL
jgi:hypothetical protein